MFLLLEARRFCNKQSFCDSLSEAWRFHSEQRQRCSNDRPNSKSLRLAELTSLSTTLQILTLFVLTVPQ